MCTNLCTKMSKRNWYWITRKWKHTFAETIIANLHCYMFCYTQIGWHFRISVLSSSTVCSSWSVCICFATSEVVELGLRCSLNLAFSYLSVSPTYVASHSSHLILYTGPTTFSLSTVSLSFTNSWRNVFVGLKYVGMPDAWQQNPDGLKEGWRKPFTSEHWTLASTGMEEGTTYHQYGITS